MTDEKTVQMLARQMINRLDHDKVIEYKVEKRAELTNGLKEIVGQHIGHETGIREEALQLVESQREKLEDQGLEFSDKDLYERAKSSILQKFDGEEIHGLFYAKPPKDVAAQARDFLLTNDLVEDVFATDEELDEALIKSMLRFNPAQVS